MGRQMNFLAVQISKTAPNQGLQQINIDLQKLLLI